MRDLVERGFLWSLAASVVAFVGYTVGLEFDFLGWLPWVFLAIALIAVGVLGAEARGVQIAGNRLVRHAFGWTLAAVMALIL